MKVLLIQSANYVPSHGGSNKANRMLMEAFAAGGHEARAVSSKSGIQDSSKYDPEAELSSRGIEILGREGDTLRFRCDGVEVVAGSVPELPDLIRSEVARFAPDWILMSSDDPKQKLQKIALEVMPHRVVYLAHTPLMFPFGPHALLPSAEGTEMMKKLAGVISVSKNLSAYMKEWGGLESTVLPFPAYGKGPFEKIGKFDEGYLTLINPCEVKGIAFFLWLADRFPDLPFSAVPTWGTNARDLEELKKRKNIRLTEPEDDTDRLFANTRIVLMPSLWLEGFPLTCVEAMLRGIPVVASDVGGLPESKLGVDYVIPVKGIQKYAKESDERRLPKALLEEQDMTPWENVVRALTTDRATYERVSRQSYEAANAFHRSIHIDLFARYLDSLAK